MIVPFCGVSFCYSYAVPFTKPFWCPSKNWEV